MPIPLDEQAMLTTLLSQSHRKYHNINHIMDCLTELKNWELNTSVESTIPWFVEYAIWYHDIVYNPYYPAGENEKQSADAFLTYSSSRIHSFNRDQINTMILSTANHTVIQDVPMETQVMLDIDLSGLGKSSTQYFRNTENIIAEYYNSELVDIMDGRLKFLKVINLRESFYYTDYFRDLYHTQSKNNVETEIELLEESLNSDYPSEYLDIVQELAHG